MANITYTPTFAHEDWIDNEDVVQASGSKGFNKKFHDIENEFSTLSTVVGTVDTEIKKIQRLNFMTAPPTVTLNPGATSTEVQVDTYAKASMPPNIEKVYFAAIYPLNAVLNIQHTFLYRTVAPGMTGVSVVFFNPAGAQAQFNFRIMALATA